MLADKNGQLTQLAGVDAGVAVDQDMLAGSGLVACTARMVRARLVTVASFVRVLPRPALSWHNGHDG